MSVEATEAGIALANRTVKRVEAVDQKLFGILGTGGEAFVSGLRQRNSWCLSNRAPAHASAGFSASLGGDHCLTG